MVRILEEHYPERVHVGVPGDRLRIADLLGRHVSGRAEHLLLAAPRARTCVARVDAFGLELRASPVEHEHLAVLAEHDVGRLEVAMDDAVLVRELDGLTHLDERVEEAVERETRRHRRVARAELGEHVPERPAADALHREVGPAVGLAHLVHRHDGRVLEPGLDATLVHEALRRAADARGAEDLDGDVSPDPRVAVEPDLRRAAASDGLLQLVALLERRRLQPLQGRRAELDGDLLHRGVVGERGRSAVAPGIGARPLRMVAVRHGGRARSVPRLEVARRSHRAAAAPAGPRGGDLSRRPLPSLPRRRRCRSRSDGASLALRGGDSSSPSTSPKWNPERCQRRRLLSRVAATISSS